MERDIIEEPFVGDLPSTPADTEVKGDIVTSDIDAANRTFNLNAKGPEPLSSLVEGHCDGEEQ
ncbi:hypothetical protein AAVH_28291 [Aphelenchoides avenae]|nr:hypothetical protein AAVH_28291 [Aphelenchus avenae]